MLTTFLGAALALTAAVLFVIAYELAKLAEKGARAGYSSPFQSPPPILSALRAVALPLVAALAIVSVAALL